MQRMGRHWQGQAMPVRQARRLRFHLADEGVQADKEAPADEATSAEEAATAPME